MDKWDERAAELLPCHEDCGKTLHFGEQLHGMLCPIKFRPAVAAELHRMGSMSEAYDLTVAQLSLDNARQTIKVLRAEIERLNAQSEKSPL